VRPVILAASQKAPAASGSSTRTASAMARRRAAPGADVHTSNQASTSSSVPPAVAVSRARTSLRRSSTPVASAATASAASRPVQARDQFRAWAVAGSAMDNSTHQGTRKAPTPSAIRRPRRISGPASLVAGRTAPAAAVTVVGGADVCMAVTVGIQRKFCKLISA
jgi:hypothetical protein